MSHGDELAVYLPDGLIDPPTNPYGRLIANAGTYRALAAGQRYRRLTFLCRNPPAPEALAHELRLGGDAPEIATAPLLSTAAAQRAGTLLFGQAYLSEPAWVRRFAGQDLGYSIVGTIFAFASATHREMMVESLLAPLHEWDAMVCSSPTLRDTVAETFDQWEDHLRSRLAPAGGGSDTAGGIRLPRPQLPVIPFGSDVEAIGAQASDPAARAQMRAHLGIGDDEVMVYHLGRLSYYDKAFPQAMFKSVSEAARHSGVRTHFVLTGWFPEGERDRARFEEVARRYAPEIPVTFLDGNDADVVARCWAAADVFLLLSDTILETFGQALVEAMAAGLPLVVSDWDGYRSIVRDRVDGFLIPTLGAAGGPLGETLALLQYLGSIGYAQYTGAVAQHTAVDVAAATACLSRLLASPDLRAAMGEAARRRAGEQFAWPVVADQYVSLFSDLAERRRIAGEQGVAGAGHRLNPLRADPFQSFSGLPTQQLGDDTILRAAPADPPDPEVELDVMFPGLRGTEQETATTLELLAGHGPMTLADLVGHFPPTRRAFVRMTVAWLAKTGAIDWSRPT